MEGGGLVVGGGTGLKGKERWGELEAVETWKVEGKD